MNQSGGFRSMSNFYYEFAQRTKLFESQLPSTQSGYLAGGPLQGAGLRAEAQVRRSDLIKNPSFAGIPPIALAHLRRGWERIETSRPYRTGRCSVSHGSCEGGKN